MIESSINLASGWRVAQEPSSSPRGWAVDPGFDDSKWHTLSALQHLQLEFQQGDDKSWGEGLREMNSTAWVYRLKFDLPEDFTGRAIDLDFSAADYLAEVWLNGEYLGSHEGDFGPFSFPIETIAQAKNNLLAVRVSAPFGIPHDGPAKVIRTCVKGLYEHADGLIPPDVNPIGIWRPVNFRAHDGIRLQRPFVDTLKLSRESATIKLRCPVQSRTDMLGVIVRVVLQGENFDEETLKDEFTVDLAAGPNEITREYELRDPKLWTVWQRGKPHLYRAEIELSVDGKLTDAASGTFGVRTVELQRSPYKFTFLLNGEPLFIKGTSYVPTCYLDEMDERGYKRDVGLAKSMRCNLIRIHVHVSGQEFYDACDREGVLVMQDSCLNWMQEETIEFEQRALKVFQEVIEHLRPHPSLAIWVAYNEPSTPRLREERPAPALYDLAQRIDPTRPALAASGKLEHDWERNGDSHHYDGSLEGGDYWMFLEHYEKFNTEFGCSAPAARETLKAHPKAAKAAANVFRHIPEVWDYQYRLLKFVAENYRRRKYNPCGGCVHFFLNDMFPQIGLGVMDYYRNPKGGYYALAEAFEPIIISFEHRETARAIWVVNDLQERFPDCEASWSVLSPEGNKITSGNVRFDLPADKAVRVARFNYSEWPLEPGQDCTVLLTLTQEGGTTLASNRYQNPFKFPRRPQGYPMLFNEETGMKVYGFEE